MIEKEIAELMSTPDTVLKTRVIENRVEPVYQHLYTPPDPLVRNSRINEMYRWRRKFIGHTALEFKHCVLIINIRRNDSLQENLDAFFTLWLEEVAFLTKVLNTKWLVSACDTFADYSNDDAERATALIGATMLKTIKIYETELRFRFQRLQVTERPDYEITELFDGLRSFHIGYGDVVYNIKKRIDRLVLRGTTASLILGELFRRVCEFDTAFSRLRAEHIHEPTLW